MTHMSSMSSHDLSTYLLIRSVMQAKNNPKTGQKCERRLKVGTFLLFSFKIFGGYR